MIAFRKSFFAVLLFVSAVSGVRAQQFVRLTDHWEFLRSDLGGVWEAVRPVAPGDPGSVPSWQPVCLPHCVNARDAVDPDVNYYQGPAWYRTQLTIHNPFVHGRVLLHFEGAGQKTDVYIYTTKVGTHTGGYDEWTVDITDAVANFEQDPAYKGKIPLSIRCDNSRDVERIPSSMSDFTIYGGLYRYLNLVYVPPVSIAGVYADAVLEGSGKKGRVTVRTDLYAPGGEKAAGIAVTLRDPAGKIVYVSKDTASFVVTAPQVWSTEHPALYRLDVSVTSRDGSVCTQSTEIGFRNYTFVDHGPFLLNGQRLLIRGTHRHEDHAGLGAAMTEEGMRSEMIAMKEMGVNYIRLAHYQQSRIILHLCDSLGILVWEEIPWCRGGLGGPAYQEQAQRMLTNMISQHYNHPAVIIWGLGNEIDWPGDFPEFDKQKIRTFLTALNVLAHRLDPSRKTAIRRCESCSDIPDIYSPSIWAGWYRGIFTEYKSATEEEFKKIPHFLHMEWGGDSHARRHSENPDQALMEVHGGQGTDERTGDASLFGGAARVSKDGDWSETYICNLIDWHLKEQETMPWLTGAAQWVFKDFATPLRPDNPVPFVNQKGVMERDGTKKEVYYVFQSYWTTKLMAHIYGHSWPIRWGGEGEQKMVKVYSNGDEVELFLNGKAAGVRKRKSADYPAAGLRWNLVFEKGENTVRVVAHKGKEMVTDSIRFVYQTEKWGKPAQMRIEKVEEGARFEGAGSGGAGSSGVGAGRVGAGRVDTVTVSVRLFDDKGVPCLDAMNWVRWGIAGDGKLIDDLGTSTGSRRVQVYNGEALIRVSGGGNSVVSAAVEGLPTVFLRTHALAAGAAGPVGTAAAPGSVGTAVAAGSVGTAAAGRFYDEAAKTLRNQVLEKAAWAMRQPPITVTANSSPRSAGGKHDFFSEADYWWPNPMSTSADSPYIQRDGQSNPDNFVEHRKAMIRLSRIMGALASAYKLTGDDKYVKQALVHCKAWFVDTATLMNPSLLYSQAIKGRVTGRGTGIIDAIQLMEVTQGLLVMEKAKSMDKPVLETVRQWFRQYLQWVTTHPYGRDEMNATNNHGTCWVMQVAAFATFTQDRQWMDFCRERYKKVLLPNQIAADGSFPQELKRTKPYGYSIFNLDAMTTICQILSTPEDNLWTYRAPNGRSIEDGIAFLYPFVADKTKWAHPPDVMYWKEWPVAQPFLIFGANADGGKGGANADGGKGGANADGGKGGANAGGGKGGANAGARKDWFDTWQRLNHDPETEEVIRNLPIRNPLIWIN